MNARAAALGAAVVVAVAVPVATIGSVALDEGSNLVFAVALLVLLGVVAGGAVAGDTASGAVAGVAGIAVAQAVSVLLDVVRDDDVQWAAVLANLVLAAAAGALGGSLRRAKAMAP